MGHGRRGCRQGRRCTPRRASASQGASGRAYRAGPAALPWQPPPHRACPQLLQPTSVHLASLPCDLSGATTAPHQVGICVDCPLAVASSVPRHLCGACAGNGYGRSIPLKYVCPVVPLGSPPCDLLGSTSPPGWHVTGSMRCQRLNL